MTHHVFSELLAASPVARSTGCVLDDGRVSVTGPQLLERISILRATLSALIEPGDVVCVVLPSSAAFMILQAALVDLGAVFIAVPSDATHLTAAVADLGSPKWYVFDDAAESRRPADTCGVLVIDPATLSVAIEQNPTSSNAVPTGATARVVVATSGSTGRSKLVDLSLRAYWRAATSIAEVTGIEGADTVLHHLPLQRGAGWLAWGALAAGARNIIQPARSAELPDALLESRATATFCVSVGLHELIRRDLDAGSLPDLRTLYYSSGTVSVEMKHSLATRFGARLIQDYGMTEVPEPLAVLSRKDHLRGLRDPNLLNSVGRPLNADRVTTDGPATADAPLPILVRSPYMFDGYWRGTRHEAQSWYRTDDLGYFDDDGYLHLCGRRSRTVRSGGVTFALDDIEAAVTAIPGVASAELSVVPDDRFGERVTVAATVTHDGPSAEQIKTSLPRYVPDVRMAALEISVVSQMKPIANTKDQ